MADILIKPDRDEDFYILWSLNVDAPVSWGSRADLEGLQPKYFPTQHREARFQRADNTSTSGRGALESSWDVDEQYVYHSRDMIRRSRMREMIEIMKTLPNDGSQDECAEIMALMEPEEIR